MISFFFKKEIIGEKTPHLVAVWIREKIYEILLFFHQRIFLIPLNFNRSKTNV
jgi:hypothetical protein